MLGYSVVEEAALDQRVGCRCHRHEPVVPFATGINFMPVGILPCHTVNFSRAALSLAASKFNQKLLSIQARSRSSRPQFAPSPRAVREQELGND
jgi:hypothetical protein